MNVIEQPQNPEVEASQPPTEDGVPAAEKPQKAPAPEVEVPLPQHSLKSSLTVLCALAALGAFAYWKRAALPVLLNLVPPYSSAIAFVSLGIIGAFYKDRYRHTAAKWAAVTIMLVFGFLMGVNTYRDRAARAQEKIDRANEKAENVNTSLGIVKSVDKASGELKDFKDKVNPDEIRSEMTGLRSTMDKLLHPPRATMLFTFAPYPDHVVLGGPFVAVRDITLPLSPEGSVHVRFNFFNNSEVVAETFQTDLDICTGCKFAKEPEGWVRIPGSPETQRNHVYGDAPARGALAELAIDVLPPPGAGTFDIRVRYRCKTCVLEEAGTVGTIRIQRD